MLYELVRRHLETMLQDGCQRTEHGFGYPRYVERTFRRYLACGIPSEGLARLKCASCSHEHLVPFSCKQRAVCPSCQARRMTDLAAQLCDGLLPRAPYRQIVFTFPVPLRLAMIRDSAVLSAVLKRTIRGLFAQLRRRAKAQGVAQPLVAALSMIQRFGGALNVNVHFHVLVPDGVFTLAQDQSLSFVELPAPSDEQVYQLVLAVSRRVDRWMARWLTDNQHVDPDDDQHRWLEHALAEAQPSPRPGWHQDIDPPVLAAQPRCAEFCGYAVHAQTSVAADDRAGLERLLKYGLRAPLCLDRLHLLNQGRTVRYRFSRPWRNGRGHIDLEPVALLRRLALLIPPPRQRLLRHHGLFAPRAAQRDKLAPLLPATELLVDVSEHLDHGPADPPAPSESKTQTQRPTSEMDAQRQTPELPIAPAPSTPAPPKLPPRRRFRWSELLRRAFAIDVLTCVACGGSMRLIALIKDPEALAKICAHMAWPTSVPECDPARLPRQLTFDSDDPGQFLPSDTAEPPDPEARAPPSASFDL